MQTHENFSEYKKVEGSSDRSFGLVMAVAFMLLALFPVLNGDHPYWWAVAVSVTFLGFSLLFTRALRTPKRIWLKFGEL